MINQTTKSICMAYGTVKTNGFTHNSIKHIVRNCINKSQGAVNCSAMSKNNKNNGTTDVCTKNDCHYIIAIILVSRTNSSNPTIFE